MDVIINNPFVSVIIPVYNCEKYIARAANSILSQPSNENIELIIVDDGSTDATAHIIDALANKHSNVRVIHKCNGGASSARNAGIEVAAGHYLAFLDADDWWTPNVFDEGLVSLITKDPVDLFAFGMRKVSPDMKFFQDELRKDELILAPQKVTYGGHCSFFYSTEMVKRLAIRFPIAKRWDDPPFVNLCIYFAKSARCVDKILFNYWMNPSSALHTDTAMLHILEHRKALIQERDLFASLGVEHDNERAILSMIVSLLPRLCVENSLREVKKTTSGEGYELLYQDEILPWKALQHSFRLWKFSPTLFYLRSQLHPGIMLHVKNILNYSFTTRKFADWVQYRVIEKWQKF